MSLRSHLCPPGWSGIVVLGGAALATAPDHGTARRIEQALGDLPAVALADGGTLGGRLPAAEILGPAALAYLDPAEFQARPGLRGLGARLGGARRGLPGLAPRHRAPERADRLRGPRPRVRRRVSRRRPRGRGRQAAPVAGAPAFLPPGRPRPGIPGAGLPGEHPPRRCRRCGRSGVTADGTDDRVGHLLLSRCVGVHGGGGGTRQ